MTPSRQQRRTLDRKSARVLAKHQGTPIACEADATPRTHAILITERTQPVVIRRAWIGPALALAGFQLIGLAETLSDVAASPQDDGRRYPALILIDGWIQVAWMDLHALVKGGAA